MPDTYCSRRTRSIVGSTRTLERGTSLIDQIHSRVFYMYLATMALDDESTYMHVLAVRMLLQH